MSGNASSPRSEASDSLKAQVQIDALKTSVPQQTEYATAVRQRATVNQRRHTIVNSHTESSIGSNNAMRSTTALNGRALSESATVDVTPSTSAGGARSRTEPAQTREPPTRQGTPQEI